MSENQSKLQILRENYLSLIKVWKQKNDSNHGLWDAFTNAEKMLEGVFKGASKVMIDNLEQFLLKFLGSFTEPIVISDSDDEASKENSDISRLNRSPTPRYDPDEENEIIMQDKSNNTLKDGDYIELSDSDDDISSASRTSCALVPECDIDKEVTKQYNLPKAQTYKKKPQIEIPSLNEYKCKTIRLRPAAAYAAVSDKNKKERQILTVPYKEPIKQKPICDPKAVAIKLNKVTQKIYNKNLKTFESILKEIEAKDRTNFEKRNKIVPNRKKSICDNKEDSQNQTNVLNKDQNSPSKRVLRPRSKSLWVEKPQYIEDEDIVEEKIKDSAKPEEPKRKNDLGMFLVEIAKRKEKEKKRIVINKRRLTIFS